MIFTPSYLLVIVLILIVSIIIHEVSHGYAALKQGDDTAEKMGRLTLNPIKHIDPIGSIMVPLFLIITSNIIGGGIIFGWAKPVPVNPNKFKDTKYGQAKVAFSGPAANFAVALFFGLLIRLNPFPVTIFFDNLIFIFSFIVWINLLLGIFNLMPIPPLDGSHIFFTFIPLSNTTKIFLRRNGFLFLLIFIFFFFPLIIPIISFLFNIITGSPFF